MGQLSRSSLGCTGRVTAFNVGQVELSFSASLWLKAPAISSGHWKPERAVLWALG